MGKVFFKIKINPARPLLSQIFHFKTSFYELHIIKVIFDFLKLYIVCNTFKLIVCLLNYSSKCYENNIFNTQVNYFLTTGYKHT